MCGICGVVRLDGNGPIDADRVRAMRDAISHRGPDDEGLHVDGPVAFGHRRLSIIDLSGGAQPMSDPDGRVWIAFNGEIFNFRDVARTLEAKGRVFRTRSDTEVILQSYAEYGDDCVDHFRGMFAFAIWDGPRRRLLLVRDRLGIKPLYYATVGGALVFASEIKSLLRWPGLPREVDEVALGDYLRHRYVPGPLTMFRGISKLQPGHRLVVEAGQTTIRRYWDLPEGAPEPVVEPEADLRARLEECVRLRLVSDVPLGAFLSGGIDSTTIVGTMQRLCGEPVQTFSVGYPDGAGSEWNEFTYARMAATKFGATHRELVVEPRHFWDELRDLVWHFDEPVADSASLPLFLLSRFAREHVTVVLSGEGADEILGGYGIYRRRLAIDRLRRVPLLRHVARAAAPFASRKLRRYLRAIGDPLDEPYLGVSKLFSEAELDELLSPEHRAPAATAPAIAAELARRRETDPLRRMLYFDLKVWLPDDLLVKADKMTMASSLELRVPFLDHTLVEWAWRLPSDWKVRGGEGKHLLRRAFADVVPRPILERAKRGFPVPIRGWFERELAALARSTLLDGDAGCRRYFRRAAIEQLLDRHEAGREDVSGEIFALLVFELWHHTFIDSSRRFE